MPFRFPQVTVYAPIAVARRIRGKWAFETDTHAMTANGLLEVGNFDLDSKCESLP